MTAPAPLNFPKFVDEYIKPIKQALPKGRYDVLSQLDKEIQLAGENNFNQLKSALVGFKEECNKLYSKKFIKNTDYTDLNKKLDELAKQVFPSVAEVQQKVADETRGVFPQEILEIIMGYSLEDISKNSYVVEQIRGMLTAFCRSSGEELRMAKAFASKLGIQEETLKTAVGAGDVMAFVKNLASLREEYKLSNVEKIFGPVTEERRVNMEDLHPDEQGKTWLADAAAARRDEIREQTVLNLNNKGLTGLPGMVFFEKLKMLSATNNQIISLPDDITELEDLQILDVHNNAIRQLPPGLKNMQNLRGLVISGNPISDFNQLIDSLPPKLQALTISEDDQWYIDNREPFREALKARRPGVELWERSVGKNGKIEDNQVR